MSMHRCAPSLLAPKRAPGPGCYPSHRRTGEWRTDSCPHTSISSERQRTFGPESRTEPCSRQMPLECLRQWTPIPSRKSKMSKAKSTSIPAKRKQGAKRATPDETHQPAAASCTRSPVGSTLRSPRTRALRLSDNQNSLRANPRGPTLLEDFILREKITHFDHERIPERIVHARATGVHGFFELTASLKTIHHRQDTHRGR